MDDKNNINGFDEQDFDVPGDYFESLASNIQERCMENDELRKIAPTLADIPKYNPFIVPDGYFDELPAVIQEKIIAVKKRFSIAERFVWIFRPQLAVAAGLVIIALITMLIMNNNSSSPENIENVIAHNSGQTDSVADSSLYASVEAVLYEVDEATLIESFEGENIAVNNDEVASDDDIESYLVENNIDIAAIINEL